MKICFVLIFFIFFFHRGECQFPPAVGVNGTTAIHADSSVIVEWANTCHIIRGYEDIAQPQNGLVSYGSDSLVLGKADNQVVSLGDGGIAILSFKNPICNKSGFDFAVFENAFNDSFLELAFVEISSDSIHWFRFPSISLTQNQSQIETFGCIDATKINNLAGKYRALFGTPFDISDIADNENLNKQNIRYIKIVDVIGTINSLYANYDSQGNIINDPYPTPFYSGGFDLDAVGIINSCPDYVNVTNQEKVIIYPNPATNYLYINAFSNDFRMIIYDELGKIMTTFNNNNNNNIDISMLEQGIYFLRVEFIDSFQILKFIKK